MAAVTGMRGEVVPRCAALCRVVPALCRVVPAVVPVVAAVAREVCREGGPEEHFLEKITFAGFRNDSALLAGSTIGVAFKPPK